jgi:hypothetical protein
MSTTKSAPSQIVYQVRDGAADKSYWTRIGATWPHADGKGFNLQLSALPLDGRVIIREAQGDDDRPAE